MFDAEAGTCALLEQTPLRRQLEDLFDVRAGTPQFRSYANTIWLPLERRGILSEKSLEEFNLASPEIPNLALADVRNFDDLRAVLLGGEIGDLPEYGSVGSAWSNVYLAQSFARITTGRRVTAQIIADVPPAATSSAASPEGQEWIGGYLRSTWRRALLGGLEGVGREAGATAYPALGDTIRRINSERGITDIDVPFESQPRYAIGSGRSYFTIFCKTGTLDPDNEGPLLDDSIFVFTAGIWDDAANRFCRPVTGAIYLEQATMGQAQRYAARLIRTLNNRVRFNWSNVRSECHTPLNHDRNEQ